MATQKAQRAAKLKLENPSKSMGQVMLEAGYATTTANNPQELTDTKGWKQLMEHYLPDSHLTVKHREFLDAPRVLRTYKRGELMTEIEETSAESVKALDMAYKLKNRYGETNIGQAIFVNVPAVLQQKYGSDGSTKPNSK